MNPASYARKIVDEVTAALALDDDARRAELEAIAERAFGVAYDDRVNPDSPDDVSIDDVREFTSGLDALDHTTADSSPERVADWIARAADSAATIAAAPASAQFQWRSQRDDAVRDTHQATDGQVRAAGKPFDVAGHPLLYPGQPVGPPEVWANCRCTLQPAPRRPVTAAADAPKGAVMVAVPADPEAVAFPGGEDPADLHVTIGYYPADMLTAELRADLETFLNVSAIRDPTVTVSGAGTLGNDDPPATVLLLDSDELHRIRASLEAFAPPDMTHPDYTPHMTLGYGTPVPDEAPEQFNLADLQLWWQDERVDRRDVANPQGPAQNIIAAVSEEPWSKWSAADYTIEQWRRACLVTMPGGDPESKSTYKLPVRTPEGVLNKAGVHAAAAALAGARGGVDVPTAQRSQAKSKLRGLYKQLDEEPPDSLRAATIVAAPVPKPANTHDGPGWLTNPQDTERLRRYWTKGPGAAKIRWGTPGDLTRCAEQLTKYVGPYAWGTCNNLHHVVFGFFNPDSGRRGSAAEEALADTINAVFAALSEEDPMPPPASLFANPNLPAPTPMTVRAAGEFQEVYGHLADWGSCHVGLGEPCVTAPRSERDYAFFRTGEVDTDAGPVAVGHITAGTGHAELGAGPQDTVRHYDHTGTVVADVAAGEDEHGIWIHGIQRPGLSDDLAYALRAGAPSGDWRRIGGSLELVAALIVNVPGFPIPRTQVASAAERPVALVAAAIVTADPGATLPVHQIAVAVVNEQERRAADVRASAARRTRAERIADRVRRDRVHAILSRTRIVEEV